MAITITLVFQVVALVCFLLGAAPITSRVNLIALGLAFFMLSLIVV